jgi:hypothetical protein
MSKKKYYEKFKVKQRVENYEKLMWAFESIIYIIISFYAGFEFCNSQSLLWFLLFVGILVLRFQWKKIKEVTKRMVIR